MEYGTTFQAPTETQSNTLQPPTKPNNLQPASNKIPNTQKPPTNIQQIIDNTNNYPQEGETINT